MTELPENNPLMPNAGDDWENRRLCDDESCTGTVGSDGRCRVCGHVCAGALDGSSGQNTSEVSTLVPVPPDASDSMDIPTADSDWESRRLCGDESCTGAIGADGCCNVCGAPASKG